MSNSPKLDSPRPSAVALLLRQLKGMLTSSYGVAAIASLSFHAVLFAAIPRFTSVSFAAFDEDTAAAPREVPLVTLSPAEQGRLPNFNRPKLPDIPDVASSSNSTAVRTLPDVSALRRPPNIFDRYGRSQRIPTPSIRSNRLFRNPYTTSRPSLTIRNTPTQSDQSATRRTTVIDDIPSPPSVASEVDPSEAEVLATDVEQLEAQGEDVAALPELPDQGEPGAEEPEVAALDPEEERRLTQLERLQAKFQHNSENTTDEEAEANYEAWLMPPEDDSELIVATAESSEIQIASGLNLCVENPPTDGTVGILVAPDGTLEAATVLRSTGYEYLNEAAVQALSEAEFPETETAVRYPFDIVVDYDAETCQSGEDILETVQNRAQGENQNAPANEGES